MVTTLTGENNYLIKLELRKIIAEYKVKSNELTIEHYDSDNFDIIKLNESVGALSLFSQDKLIILKDLCNNRQFLDGIEKIIEFLSDDVTLVIIESKFDKRLSLYKVLKNKTHFLEFNNLKTPALTDWISSLVNSKQGDITNREAIYLIDKVGQNQELLYNEIEKLILFSPKVTINNIDVMSESSNQNTVFELIEAAFGGKYQLALKIYNNLRAQNEDPIRIIGMMTWQLNILAIIKTAKNKRYDEISREAKMSPYTLNKSMNIAKNLTLSKLITFIDNLLKIDILSKSSSIDTDEALANYILRLV